MLPSTTLTAEAAVVDSNAIQTVHGRNRPVVEFCSRTSVSGKDGSTFSCARAR